MLPIYQIENWLCYLISLDLFLKYVLKQWILMWAFPCSHLMENQISNIEKGVFDELKELERLWEHITKTFTSINQINFSFNCFLSQEIISFFSFFFVHTVAWTKTVSASFQSCSFRRMKPCLDCEYKLQSSAYFLSIPCTLYLKSQDFALLSSMSLSYTMHFRGFCTVPNWTD